MWVKVDWAFSSCIGNFVVAFGFFFCFCFIFVAQLLAISRKKKIGPGHSIQNDWFAAAVAFRLKSTFSLAFTSPFCIIYYSKDIVRSCFDFACSLFSFSCCVCVSEMKWNHVHVSKFFVCHNPSFPEIRIAGFSIQMAFVRGIKSPIQNVSFGCLGILLCFSDKKTQTHFHTTMQLNGCELWAEYRISSWKYYQCWWNEWESCAFIEWRIWQDMFSSNKHIHIFCRLNLHKFLRSLHQLILFFFNIHHVNVKGLWKREHRNHLIWGKRNISGIKQWPSLP